MKLLIIEDDVAYANALARTMTRQQFECHTVNRADAALAQARLLQPSHILLDLKLANESGLSLIAPIRAALPQVKLVLLTGFASIASAVEAMRRGADDYLAKPADTRALMNALTGHSNIDQALMLDTMSAERLEWEHLNQVLTANSGNVSATARQLGMHRRTLQRKLQRKPVNS